MHHKHLIVRGEISSPPTKVETLRVNNWIKDLVRQLEMKILLGPFTTYCDMEGNRGMTAICAIETSSITIHIWDEPSPAIIQLDVYSCSNIDKEIIFKKLMDFGELTGVRFLFIDRDYNGETLKVLESYV